MVGLLGRSQDERCYFFTLNRPSCGGMPSALAVNVGSTLYVPSIILPDMVPNHIIRVKVVLSPGDWKVIEFP